MQNAALYIRVSTDKQEELSPDAQKRLLKEYAQKNNMIVSEEFIFLESGISGKLADKRPEFQRMIGTAKLKEHPIDVILVWKYSRFARNQEESIVYKSMLKKDGIEVISISEPIIEGPFGTLIERIIEWMDEYYSIRLSGEVLRGMTEKALRGEYQSTAPYGYNMVDGELVIDKERSKIIQMIFDEYLNKNTTPFKISRSLNALGLKTNRGNQFDVRAVNYILKNPTYCGNVRWNVTKSSTNEIKDKSEWIIKKGKHEPIISENIFDAVQNKINASRRPLKTRPREINKHWLSGILKCSNCGKTLVYMEVKGRKGFQCWGYSKATCSISHYISEGKIIDAIFGAFEKVLEKSEIEYNVIKESNDEIDLKVLKEQLNKLSVKEKRIKDAYLNEIDTLEEYKQNKKLILDERTQILEKIEKMNNFKPTVTKDIMLSRVNDAYTIITSDNYDKEEKNAALSAVVEKIVFDKINEAVHIYFYFS